MHKYAITIRVQRCHFTLTFYDGKISGKISPRKGVTLKDRVRNKIVQPFIIEVIGLYLRGYVKAGVLRGVCQVDLEKAELHVDGAIVVATPEIRRCYDVGA